MNLYCTIATRLLFKAPLMSQQRVYTRDATIHILDVSIYHLFCITIQRYIARYGIVCNS